LRSSLPASFSFARWNFSVGYARIHSVSFPQFQIAQQSFGVRADHVHRILAQL
jgi:hypothetical protein